MLWSVSMNNCDNGKLVGIMADHRFLHQDRGFKKIRRANRITGREEEYTHDINPFYIVASGKEP